LAALVDEVLFVLYLNFPGQEWSDPIPKAVLDTGLLLLCKLILKDLEGFRKLTRDSTTHPAEMLPLPSFLNGSFLVLV